MRCRKGHVGRWLLSVYVEAQGYTGSSGGSLSHIFQSARCYSRPRNESSPYVKIIKDTGGRLAARRWQARNSDGSIVSSVSVEPAQSRIAPKLRPPTIRPQDEFEQLEPGVTSTGDSWLQDLSLPSPPPLTPENFAKHVKFAATLEADPKSAATAILADYVRNKDNILQYLTSDITYLIFEELVSRGETRQLRLVDWHRLLQRLVGSRPFDMPSDPQDSKRATAVLREIKRCGINPDAFVYACLYRAMKDDVRKVHAVHDFVMNSIRSNSLPQSCTLATDRSFRTLLAVYLRRPKYPLYIHRARNLWNDMKDAGITPSFNICLAFLEAYRLHDSKVDVDSKGVIKVHRLLSTLKKEKRMEQIATDALMIAHDACGHREAVKRLFDEMSWQGFEPGFTAYKLYLRAVQDHLPTNGVQSLPIRTYEKMKKNNMALDDECFRIISLAYAGAGDRAGVANMHSALRTDLANAGRELTVVPTSRSYDALIEAYSRLRDWESALGAFVELKKLNTSKSESAVKAAQPKNEQGDVGDSVKFEKGRFNYEGVSRKVLRYVASALGSKGRIAEGKAFFLEQVLCPARLEAYWGRKLAGEQKRLRLQREMAEQAVITAESGLTRVKAKDLQNLKRQLNAAKRAEEKGAEAQIGMDGPLRVVYEGFVDAWREMVEDGYPADEQAHKLMEMEEFMSEIYEEEKHRLQKVLGKLGIIIEEEPPVESRTLEDLWEEEEEELSPDRHHRMENVPGEQVGQQDAGI
ncbi:pentatricopeptide repeat domain-containing protein [Spizellomyces punctatus DAOM BR117]|uniref:Pentatricopeptide repeat domain-containing protein n=1 Tax=Spizellomyces punctatus (strain DAOM BR117) TaxID=645134 RepID=A0A0L0HIB4_SPIPD|nr:pentatricopeptide repeat domain-containing protein [Spizellomyces punctatus DAOM BR117]KND00803.1 pentatricopeptide repeat domain-containing protein [Spizellomyces punctatus DAOM BR117]|eukprot:XP_016608842.1 pentatricopeptide repeat domain-containing protein [Spizellomyces punctatus DAOM BR117]